MATRTYTGTTINGGQGESLATGEDAVISAGALVGTNQIYGVGLTASTSDHDIYVYGSIFGGVGSIMIGSDPTRSSLNRVIVYEGGSLSTNSEGLYAMTAGFYLENAGNISGTYGVEVYARGGFTSTIINSGSIIGFQSTNNRAGIVQVGTDKLTVTNTGLIKGALNSFDGTVLGPAVSEITNSGVMIGNALLGGGDDL
jgi:hypothetical protein